MQIVSAASAFPKHYYSQAVLLQALQQYWGAELKNPELLRRLHRNTGVDGRHLALPAHAYSKLSDWGEVNDLWIEVALDLGKQAICRALTHAGLAAQDLGAFFLRRSLASRVLRSMLCLLTGSDCRQVFVVCQCSASAAWQERRESHVPPIM